MSIGSFVIINIATIIGVALNFKKYRAKEMTLGHFLLNTGAVLVLVSVAAYFLLINH